MIENHAVFAETVAAELFSEDDVVIVPGTQRALTRLEQGPPFDAALVDFDLDDGIGTDLVRELRESGYEGVIVAMSAKEHGNALLVRAGADVACSKMEFRSVRPLLESLLERVQIDAPRIDRAVVALEGLSVGDAFGDAARRPRSLLLSRCGAANREEQDGCR